MSLFKQSGLIQVLGDDTGGLFVDMSDVVFIAVNYNIEVLENLEFGTVYIPYVRIKTSTSKYTWYGTACESEEQAKQIVSRAQQNILHAINQNLSSLTLRI